MAKLGVVVVRACAPLLVAAALAACSAVAYVGDLGSGDVDAAAPPAQDGATEGGEAPPPGDAGGAEEADVLRDAEEPRADAEPVVDAGCGIVRAQGGAFVPVEIVPTSPPNYSGGTIVPGAYVLTGERSYLSGPRGTLEVRETLVVTGSPTVGAFERLGESRNATGDFRARAPYGERLEYETFTGQPTMFQERTCPADPRTLQGRFTATGTTLVLFDSLEATERTYERR